MSPSQNAHSAGLHTMRGANERGGKIKHDAIFRRGPGYAGMSGWGMCIGKIGRQKNEQQIRGGGRGERSATAMRGLHAPDASSGSIPGAFFPFPYSPNSVPVPPVSLLFSLVCFYPSFFPSLFLGEENIGTRSYSITTGISSALAEERYSRILRPRRWDNRQPRTCVGI